MNDNNSKKNRPKSQIMMPNSTSPLPSHGRKNGSSDSLPNHRYENEWEVRSKELAEAKCRVAQMEKTMRWWSDCTDNWRKKWSEVKTERNELRKELRITRNQMEKMMKQFPPRHQQETLISAGISTTVESHLGPTRDSKQNGFAIYSNTQVALAMSVPASSQMPYHPNSKSISYDSSHHAQQAIVGALSRKNAQTQTSALCSTQLSVIDKEIVSLLEEKVAHLTRKLDEVNRRLIVERDDKSHLEMTVERLRRDLSDLHELYDSLKKELSDINGKEFTESEVESYAEEETEEAKLIQQLTHGTDEVDDLEQDDSDAENEAETDKHTPTADADVGIAQFQGNPDGDAAQPIANPSPSKANDSAGMKMNDSLDSQHESLKNDLSSSIQVEISEVHKKLDLKTFISDVAELVGSSSHNGSDPKLQNGSRQSKDLDVEKEAGQTLVTEDPLEENHLISTVKTQKKPEDKIGSDNCSDSISEKNAGKDKSSPVSVENTVNLQKPEVTG